MFINKTQFLKTKCTFKVLLRVKSENMLQEYLT